MFHRIHFRCLHLTPILALILVSHPLVAAAQQDDFRSSRVLMALLVDTDRDGHLDMRDAFPRDPSEYLDSDGDGVGDNGDAFPHDPAEQLDTDADGVGDNADEFPADPDEQLDTDNDGVGDNADAFPENPNEQVDSDADGVGDNADAFPTDPAEQFDTDGDGIGDNADAFPNDPTEQNDTDSDGVGDNTDAFPLDPGEQYDSDGDGVGDNADFHPNDPQRTDAAIGGFYRLHYYSPRGDFGIAIAAFSEDGTFIAAEDPEFVIDGLYIRGEISVEGGRAYGNAVQIAPDGFADFTLDNGVRTRWLNLAFVAEVLAEREYAYGYHLIEGMAGYGTFDILATSDLVYLYNQPSSLARVAGRYRDIRTFSGIDITVNNQGIVRDNMAGCTITGTVGLVDPTKNFYSFALTVSACPGFVEGHYTGYGAVDESGGAPALIVAGDDGFLTPFVVTLDRFP